MTKKFLFASTALVAAVVFAGAAQAGGTTKAERQAQELQELKARIEKLEQEAADDKIANGARLNKVEETQNAVQWTFNDLRPVVRTGDGRFELAIRGRAQLDFGSYEQDPADYGSAYNCFAAAPSNLCDQGGGTVFRRVRFGIEGKFFRDFIYELRFDFGGSNAEGSGVINIARVGYTGIPNLTIKAGAIQPIITLYDATSSADLTTMERASVITTVVGPFGGDNARKGVEATFQKENFLYDGDNFILSGAFTGQRVGTTHAGSPDDEGTQALGRIAYRVYSDADANIQLGASGSEVLSLSGTTPGAARNLSFSSTPELRVDNGTFVSTGSIPAESASLYGFEAAANFMNFFLAGEWYEWSIDRDRNCIGCSATAVDPTFSGWYVEGSWIITGERKSYKAGATNNNVGVWSSPKPASPFTLGGGIGAWELTARYSELDLNSDETFSTANGGIRGGEQSVTNIGINWYVNNNLKMVAEYAMVDVERSTTTALTGDLDTEFDIIQGRMQFSF